MSEQKESDITKSKWQPGFNWFYLVVLIGIVFFVTNRCTQQLPETTWKDFSEKMLTKGDVKRIEIVNNERVEVTIRKDSLTKKTYSKLPENIRNAKMYQGPQYYFMIGSVEVFNEQLNNIKKEYPVAAEVEVVYSKRENWIGNILTWLLPLFLIALFWIFMFRRAGGRSSMFNFGKSRARILEKGTKTNVTFKDVAGLEEAKEEIYEIVSFLKTPEKYRKLGAKIPKGILLSGPPGSGKTLLARAVAGEAGVPFFSLSASEFIEMFVGVGAARMRDLFEQAKAKAPSIIFIDEIDSIGRIRGRAQVFQANEERESTLNQLLAELDGFETNTGVIVLAATNRGDILDPALLRPGRFDRRIYLELPNLKERRAIFEVHMRPLKLDEDVNKETLAAQTPGFSGADIANICNEAALIAARRSKDLITMKDFLDAIDRVIGGLEKKSKIISPEEKKRIAYHESGHVIAGWFLENTPPVLKVSIIPRGKSLGASWYLPEEKQIITRSQFMDTICMLLGGRVAEELIYDEASSNAVDDLENVTKQAYTMVLNYGLSDSFRNISYYDSTGRMEYSFHKPYSEKTAEMIDNEVQQIVAEAHEKTTQLLSDHLDQLHQLAEELEKKETLHKKAIEEILGKRRESDTKKLGKLPEVSG